MKIDSINLFLVFQIIWFFNLKSSLFLFKFQNLIGKCEVKNGEIIRETKFSNNIFTKLKVLIKNFNLFVNKFSRRNDLYQFSVQNFPYKLFYQQFFYYNYSLLYIVKLQFFYYKSIVYGSQIFISSSFEKIKNKVFFQKHKNFFNLFVMTKLTIW